MKGPLSVQVRQERAGDQGGISRVNSAAFPSPAEAGLVDSLRQAGGISLSLVAEHGGEIIGHALLSPVAVDGCNARTVGLGPVAVLPDFQRRGAGSALVRSALAECPSMGVGAVFVLGHPEYYPRFGFVPASRFRLRFPADVPDAAFMALEVVSGSLSGASGIVRFRPEFDGV